MLAADDLLIVALPATLVAVLVVFTRRRCTLGRCVALLLLATYAMLTISVTFFPMPVSGVYLALLRAEGSVPVLNLVPGATFRDVLTCGTTATALRQLGGNALLLAPAGVLLPRLWQRLDTIKRASLSVLAVAMAIEVSQLMISILLRVQYKSFDVDDLVLNALGGASGYLLWRCGRHMLRNSPVLDDLIERMRAAAPDPSVSGL